MQLSTSIRHTKHTGLLSALLISSIWLPGCAIRMPPLDYKPVQSLTTTHICRHASILITNLTQTIQHRQYQLEDGKPCLEINAHE